LQPERLSFAYHGGGGRGQGLERIQGLLSFELLDETQDSIEYRNYEDAYCLNQVTNDQRNDGSGYEDIDEERLNLVQRQT
jgi:hypothetical protein